MALWHTMVHCAFGDTAEVLWLFWKRNLQSVPRLHCSSVHWRGAKPCQWLNFNFLGWITVKYLNYFHMFAVLFLLLFRGSFSSKKTDDWMPLCSQIRMTLVCCSFAVALTRLTRFSLFYVFLMLDLTVCPLGPF